MSKIIKPIVIALASVILFIFLVLLITPMLFKNQLMEIAKTELNKMFLAKVDFKDLKLSFIRNFPNAYIGLDGLEVLGVGDFEDELLVSFDRFSVTVDLVSAIKMDNIEVKSILLDKARLNGHILEDGSANWNIFKPSETSEEETKEIPKEEEIAETKEETETEESSPFVFKVGLTKFEIRDLQAAFRDDKSKMAAEFEALNLNVRGDMRRENVDLKLKLSIDGIDFWLDGVRLANKVSVGFVSDAAADLKNLFFVIKDNKFNLNDIVLKLDGSVGIADGDINADVTFATDKTDFKSLMSLVPAVYMNDFKNLKTTGSLSISGDIKGTYNQNQMPIANVNLNVDNATFSYPNLPKSVSNINIAVKAHYDGEVFDRTTADVDRFSFVIAGNPFNAELHVKTPESDMQVAASFAGKIDFDSLVDIIPLDNITLNGLLECDVSLAGRMSTLKNERYEDFQAQGQLKLTGFAFESPDFPQGAQISSTQLNFTPRRVELANLDAKTGNTDISLRGSLENFIPFIFNKETVRGTLALRSNNIDLNQFMGGDKKEEKGKEKKEKTEKPEEVKTEMSVIEVPKNVDFALTVNIGNILFDKLDIKNTTGSVTVKDGKLDMRNLSLNMLEGSMVLNGEYNTQNIAVPFINFNMNINQFDIPSAITSFSFIENILPEPQNYSGKVSAAMTLYSKLEQNMSPEMNSIESKGRLQTHNLKVSNSKVFATTADLLKNESWRNPALGDVTVDFEIRDGRVYIEKPIVINLQQARMEISGDQGLDMSMNYKLAAIVPSSTIGSGATDILSKIPGGGVKEINVAGLIRGTAKNPAVSLSVADMATAVTDQVVGAVKAQVSEEVNRQIEKIMAEAQKQADSIRSTAKTGADKVRSEANSAADRVMANAGSNPVQRGIAQTAANKLRSEGETNARKLEEEGETQARNVLAAAQRQADNLKR
ncbi:MAG: AsmA family protein [Treponema sp.]|nr:AsmA family protein [Treponema sp.]